jgi:predicted DNA-binding transcriptional regulator YafY
MRDGLRSAERRKKIVEFLVANKYSTRESLANEFRVSKRTITRDIVILSSEIPIFTKSGNKGGIYILPQYKINTGYLTLQEEICLRELADEVTYDRRVIILGILDRFTVISTCE